VTLSIDGDMLVLQGDEVARRADRRAGGDGGGRRIAAGHSLSAARRAKSRTTQGLPRCSRISLADERVAGWDRSWRVVLGASRSLPCSRWSARFGLPAIARTTADRLPPSALDTLSSQIQKVLERAVFSTTQVPGQRLAALQAAFDTLELPADTKGRLNLNFRRSDSLGANALALPSGTIFVTDALVEMTDDDRLVLAVIAHEAGHVHRRHGLRQIIQSTIMGGLVTSSATSALGAAAPTALLQEASRDLEREADAHAAEVLTLNGMPASLRLTP
jgi:Zn-dependent protease with chaperone function